MIYIDSKEQVEITVSSCSFKDTYYGTVVYDRYGRYRGLYETHDAAVTHIRELSLEHMNGGNDDGI